MDWDPKLNKKEKLSWAPASISVLPDYGHRVTICFMFLLTRLVNLIVNSMRYSITREMGHCAWPRGLSLLGWLKWKDRLTVYAVISWAGILDSIIKTEASRMQAFLTLCYLLSDTIRKGASGICCHDFPTMVDCILEVRVKIHLYLQGLCHTSQWEK